MKMVLGKSGLMVLLALGMTAALARPSHDWQASEAARIERQQAWVQASQARRGDEGRQQPDRRDGSDDRGNRQFRDGSSQQGGHWQAPAQDDGRRGGRMSPEERRELRRQIDEAGRNIYAPRGR